MRIITIQINNGALMQIDDNIDETLEDATKKLTEMLKNDKIMMLIGKNSSAIVRPSSISGINIVDHQIPDPSLEQDGKQQIKTESDDPTKIIQNEEQNIDRICDVEE
jgi:hypothetical protein